MQGLTNVETIDERAQSAGDLDGMLCRRKLPEFVHQVRVESAKIDLQQLPRLG